MKKRKEYFTIKRMLTLVVHRDGSCSFILICGNNQLKLCFMTLDYYYMNVCDVSNRIAGYIMREQVIISSIYMDIEKKMQFYLFRK